MSIKVDFFLLYSMFFHFTIEVYYFGESVMDYILTAKNVLHQLGIGKTYSGYDYILHGLNLILHDENLLNCVTKTLYIDISKEYHTSSTCVERNIRKVIEVIWKNDKENERSIVRIFGTRYLSTKPSNKEFLELLYEYVKSHTLLQKLYDMDKVRCPFSNQVCTAYNEIIEKLINLE